MEIVKFGSMSVGIMRVGMMRIGMMGVGMMRVGQMGFVQIMCRSDLVFLVFHNLIIYQIFLNKQYLGTIVVRKILPALSCVYIVKLKTEEIYFGLLLNT